MDSKDQQIKELRELVAKLTARIEELELALAKAQKDSSTSSKPPSSDIAKPKPKKKPGRPKKPRRGGQPGHSRDEMSEEGFHRSMLTHRERFLEVVRKPPSTKEAKNLATRFAVVEYREADSERTDTYDLSQNYFQFMFADAVEPTNNDSEQQIRQCVIDRRITQGTRSEAGMRYHERMWTMIATCRKQNRSVFGFLDESIAAKLTAAPSPTLLA